MPNRLQCLATSTLLACGLALGAPALSYAQSATPTAAPTTKAADPVEARITQMHAKLHVTPEQEPSFAAMAQVMRDNRAEHRSEMQQNAQKGPQTAVEDLNTYAQMVQARADGIKRLSQSFEAFYATLSDDQKKAADEMFRQHKKAMKAQARHGEQPSNK